MCSYLLNHITFCLMTLTQNTISKAVVASLLALAVFAGVTVQAATPDFDTTGTYEVKMTYLGNDYGHDVTLTQANDGTLTGNGGSPVGANVYTWVITSGTVSGNTIAFSADYTATADAVTPLTVMQVNGTIALDGSMSGVWSDNYQGGARSGTFETVVGVAEPIMATLAAEDFGVVSYDTGLGILKGYTAGFGLTDATFENAQSVVIKLYSGATLLQTNTSTAQVGIDIVGTQISTPFDVSGTFNYATDGYWVNVRAAEYGQTMPATKVVATVTLEDGQVVTAENTMLVGDPTTIYPDVVEPPVVTTPTEKSQCKNGGWKTFTDPSFKNQGKCVSYVEHLDKHHDDDEDEDDDDEDEDDDKKDKKEKRYEKNHRGSKSGR